MVTADREVLERLYHAFNRRDMDAMLDCFDSEIEIEETEDLDYAALLLRVLGPRFVVLSGGYRGHEEVRRLFETIWAISDWFEVEPEDYIPRRDALVVPLVLRARSAEAGVEGEAQTVHVWSLSGGRATRLRVFADLPRAFEAAGPPAPAEE